MKMQDLWEVVRQQEHRAFFVLIVASYAYIMPSSLPLSAALVGLSVVYTLFVLEYSRHVSSWQPRRVRRASAAKVLAKYYAQPLQAPKA